MDLRPLYRIGGGMIKLHKVELLLLFFFRNFLTEFAIWNKIEIGSIFKMMINKKEGFSFCVCFKPRH